MALFSLQFAMNECLNHTELAANFVCAVCGRYFCEECVGERFYPRPGYICHECSGEKPAEPPPPAPEYPGKADKDKPDASSWAESLMAPPIEWGVIGLCLILILGLAGYRYGQGEWEPVLLSDKPEDLATYCLSVLNALEAKQASATLADVLRACPEPIVVTDDADVIVVSTPDAELYGFSEIEVSLNPLTLTVME
jgi:hypothetical protein